MKKKEKEVLKKKLLTAIKKVLKENKDTFKQKTENTVIKAIKKIIKTTDKIKIKPASKTKV